MRKVIDVTITAQNAPSADGRDNGKMFRITEMSAYDAEKWAMRANMAVLPKLSQEISPEIIEQIQAAPGMLTLQRIGILLGSLDFIETERLMDELIEKCVQYIPDPSRHEIVRPIGLAGAQDIEEAATYACLRREAMGLHSNFILVASLLELISATTTWAPTSSSLPTSQEELVPSLPPERPPSRTFRRSIR